MPIKIKYPGDFSRILGYAPDERGKERNMDNTAGCIGGMIGCFMSLVIFLAIYLFACWVLSRIGQKFGQGTLGQWCIPIYNLYLLCLCAEVSPLWILGFFIPFVNIAAGVYVWGVISARLGKEFWLWGILCGLLGLPVLVLAFDDSKPVSDPVIPF
jgi:hypothetical protein